MPKLVRSNLHAHRLEPLVGAEEMQVGLMVVACLSLAFRVLIDHSAQMLKANASRFYRECRTGIGLTSSLASRPMSSPVQFRRQMFSVGLRVACNSDCMVRSVIDLDAVRDP